MDSAPSTPPAAQDVSRVVEHLFRHEAGKMVAILVRIFGLEHLTLAEDVVQEALARALQTWPYYGVPDNPAAWIMRASRNLALDVVRREKIFRDKQPAIIHQMERDSGATTANEPIFDEHEIADDRLRLMFACCHPLNPPEAQVALALKTLCAFSVAEISRAFLTTEAAIAKRLTRAKQKIRDEKIPFDIPTGAELRSRLGVVLQSLYLLFNEGYKASSGDKLIREDICEEAIRLAAHLAAHPAGDQPATHALLALMLMNSARSPARVDASGNLLRLQEQNRSLWDAAMIARGLSHFARSTTGTEITVYHLQAGIAACHCTAPDYAATDWKRILGFYDLLLQFDQSPVVALNRAVAVAELNGPQAGIDAVNAIRNRDSLETYHLYHAVLGEFSARIDRMEAAAAHFRQALKLAELTSEKQFLSKRLNDCEKVRKSGREMAAP